MDTLEPTAPAATAEAVIEVRDLCIGFGGRPVLRGFDLTVRRGENMMVLGRSGSGKSVLIKCLVGLLRPDSGSIRILGQDVLALDQEALDRLRVRIGFLFQSSALYDSMTVRENLEFPLRRHALARKPAERDARVREALANVGLEHSADLYPAELSGGMRRRIGLARTLVLAPEIVLYDEPTSGLDPITAREIVELILGLQRKYRTSSVIISHDLHVARLAANRIAVLIDGRNHAEGTYDELRAMSDPQIQRFFTSL
ncbi:MAG: ATP-binding cassette domain-containing protein [Bacteroidetes bacterium]|nr:ATP-binding cassette domain-containing protein [Bacteroidota bacterium]